MSTKVYVMEIQNTIPNKTLFYDTLILINENTNKN